MTGGNVPAGRLDRNRKRRAPCQLIDSARRSVACSVCPIILYLSVHPSVFRRRLARSPKHTRRQAAGSTLRAAGKQPGSRAPSLRQRSPRRRTIAAPNEPLNTHPFACSTPLACPSAAAATAAAMQGRESGLPVGNASVAFPPLCRFERCFNPRGPGAPSGGLPLPKIPNTLPS